MDRELRRDCVGCSCITRLATAVSCARSVAFSRQTLGKGLRRDRNLEKKVSAPKTAALDSPNRMVSEGDRATILRPRGER